MIHETIIINFPTANISTPPAWKYI